jgi:hypothetical protein
MTSFAAARTSDQASAIGTLVSAFIDDPVERWLWPEARQYLTHFPTFVAAFGVEAFTRQTVWTLHGFAAVAWWDTPNPRTIPFYERHGFEVTTVARAGGCPPVTSMLRPAQ